MTKNQVFQIMILALGIAVIGYGLHGCPMLIVQ